jgi:hypothetical protein
MLKRSLAAALLVLSLAGPAVAQTSLSSYEAARQALLAVWAELPLTARNPALTEGVALGYGNYTPRATNSYGPGDPIHVYVEVLGYGWKDNGDGTQSELLDADLNLVDANGRMVASQEGFLSANIRSRDKLLETYLTLDATLTSFPAGNYTLQYVLHDRAAGKDATFEIPIVLTEAPDENAAPSDENTAPSDEAPAESTPETPSALSDEPVAGVSAP